MFQSAKIKLLFLIMTYILWLSKASLTHSSNQDHARQMPDLIFNGQNSVSNSHVACAEPENDEECSSYKFQMQIEKLRQYTSDIESLIKTILQKLNGKTVDQEEEPSTISVSIEEKKSSKTFTILNFPKKAKYSTKASSAPRKKGSNKRWKKLSPINEDETSSKTNERRKSKQKKLEPKKLKLSHPSHSSSTRE